MVNTAGMMSLVEYLGDLDHFQFPYIPDFDNSVIIRCSLGDGFRQKNYCSASLSGLDFQLIPG